MKRSVGANVCLDARVYRLTVPIGYNLWWNWLFPYCLMKGANVDIVWWCLLLKRVCVAVKLRKSLIDFKKVETRSSASLNIKALNQCAWMYGCFRQLIFNTGSTMAPVMYQRQTMSKWYSTHGVYITSLSHLFLFFHRKYRFMVYWQLTGWCWGWLGKNIRVVLPSCAVARIRNNFPSVAYSGFKYPQTS